MSVEGGAQTGSVGRYLSVLCDTIGCCWPKPRSRLWDRLVDVVSLSVPRLDLNGGTELMDRKQKTPLDQC